MTIADVSLSVDQYTDWAFCFPPLTSGPAQLPIDFTGATATMAWRVVPSDSSPLVEVSTTPSSSGQIVLGPTSEGPFGALPPGVVMATVSASELGGALSGITVGRYTLIVTWSNGRTMVLFEGPIAFNQGSDY